MDSDKKLLGQNCISLVSLQPGELPAALVLLMCTCVTYVGIKFVPLRTSGGELIPEAGLFVRIRKTKESFYSEHFRSSLSAPGGAELGTIAEDVEASLNPIQYRKYLPRQEAKEDDCNEDSTLRHTMSSPPCIGNPPAPNIDPPASNINPPASDIDQPRSQEIQVSTHTVSCNIMASFSN